MIRRDVASVGAHVLPRVASTWRRARRALFGRPARAATRTSPAAVSPSRAEDDLELFASRFLARLLRACGA